MRVDGEWRTCDDGKVRPTFRGVVQTQDGGLEPVRFLVDSGADSTVFSAHIWKLLGLPAIPLTLRVEGVGGRASSEVVETVIHLNTTSGKPLIFKGQFFAITDPAALDMSVLGRDIINHFALIVDRPQDVVCLLGQGHRYSIAQG